MLREGTPEGHLGININHLSHSTKLTHPGLTNRVVEALGLCPTNSNSLSTLDNKTALPREHFSKSYNGPISYGCVIVMFLYLVGHSHTNIAFAIHQCRHYIFEPKSSQMVDLKHMRRYLKGTQETGLILTPCGNLSINCYLIA